jgi:hypothetical protein
LNQYVKNDQQIANVLEVAQIAAIATPRLGRIIHLDEKVGPAEI